MCNGAEKLEKSVKKQHRARDNEEVLCSLAAGMSSSSPDPNVLSSSSENGLVTKPPPSTILPSLSRSSSSTLLFALFLSTVNETAVCLAAFRSRIAAAAAAAIAAAAAAFSVGLRRLLRIIGCFVSAGVVIASPVITSYTRPFFW